EIKKIESNKTIDYSGDDDIEELQEKISKAEMNNQQKLILSRQMDKYILQQNKLKKQLNEITVDDMDYNEIIEELEEKIENYKNKFEVYKEKRKNIELYKIYLKKLEEYNRWNDRLDDVKG